MAHWVKNLTTGAQVAAEAWVQSLAWLSRLKDPVLPQLWHRSWLGSDSILGLGNSICHGLWP